MGAVIGDWLGWRSAMGITAALSGLALLLQLLTLPSMPASAGNSLGDIVRLLGRRGVQLGMLAIVLLISGHMAGSVYVRPFLEQVTGLSTAMIALVLAGFGAAAVLGTIAGGKLADINARNALATTGTIMALAALALVLWGGNVAAAFAFAGLWGLAFGMAPVALQANLSRSATDALETSGSLMVVSFQIAIMIGAVVGGYIVDTYSAVANLMITTALAALTVVLALSQPKS
jgi:DHA1 family purine ribonucleoside efflux pump-like MFS transporter